MMNDFAETRAFAKVNLTLDVLKKRADGYHELCMTSFMRTFRMRTLPLLRILTCRRAALPTARRMNTRGARAAEGRI